MRHEAAQPYLQEIAEEARNTGVFRHLYLLLVAGQGVSGTFLAQGNVENLARNPPR